MNHLQRRVVVVLGTIAFTLLLYLADTRVSNDIRLGMFVVVAGITMFGFRHMRRTQVELERMATHDHLTGALNAGAFSRRLADELRRLGDGLRAAFDGKPSVTASIGLVSFGATEATADDLLRRADQAMYEAKRAGKDQVVSVQLPD